MSDAQVVKSNGTDNDNNSADVPPPPPPPKDDDSIMHSEEEDAFDENPEGRYNYPEPGASLKMEPLGSFQEAPFDEVYRLDERINNGTYGVVFKTSHVMYPSKLYAVKILDRLFFKHSDYAVIREVSILKELRDVLNVVQLVDFYVDSEKMYIVQGLAEGGDVFERLVHREAYTEKNARDLGRILLTVIGNLHSRNIVHRDLKPENLLLMDMYDDSSIQLCDFGVSTYLPTDDPNFKGLTTKCGTPAFVAPEVLIGKPYREHVDMWSIGCLLYMLVGGYQPFQGQNDLQMIQKIRAGDFVFHDRYWEKVHIEVKQLIASLLTVNPQYRLTAPKALESDWFNKITSSMLDSSDLTLALREMKKYNAKRRLKGCMTAVRIASASKFFKTKSISFSKAKISKTNSGNTPQKPGTDPKLNAKAKTVEEIEDRSSFDKVYKLDQQIVAGDGATAATNYALHECIHLRSKSKFVCRVFGRTGDGNDDEDVMNEVSILQTLSVYDKQIVPLADFFEQTDKFYVVMQYDPQGGDLFDRLEQKGKYEEHETKKVILNLLRGVEQIHNSGIAHRDIKPQNCILDDGGDDLKVRLSGFRFAKRVHTPQSLTHRVGTPIYVSPEVLKNIPHDERVDLWSIGIVTYILLVGYPPFMEDSQALLFKKIRTGQFCFYDYDWQDISKQAQEFIKNLLSVDPVERWSVTTALKSEWLQSIHEEEERLLREKLAKTKLKEIDESKVTEDDEDCINGEGFESELPEEEPPTEENNLTESKLERHKDSIVMDDKSRLRMMSEMSNYDGEEKEDRITDMRSDSLVRRETTKRDLCFRMHSKTVMWSNEDEAALPVQVE